MKLTIKKDNLLTGLARVIDSAQTKVTMPVLCSVLLDADTGLAISATNLDVYAQTSVPADIKERGKIAINAKRLLEIARSAPSDDITISTASNSRVAIKSGNAMFNFTGMEAAEFPALPAYKEDNKVEAAASTIANMLNSVAFCQGTDQTRFILCGIHAVLKDGELVCEATSGVRLARHAKKVDSTSAFNIIIPTFTVGILTKLLKDAASVVVMAAERYVAVRIIHAEGNGETLIVSKVVEGNFPDTQRVIPKSVKGTIKANREQLADMVGRVALACSEKKTWVSLDVAPKEVTVSAASPENGEASEAMPIEYDGSPMQIGFSHAFLSDALTNLSGEIITIGMLDGASPAVFRNDDAGYVHVLMPVKTA